MPLLAQSFLRRSTLPLGGLLVGCVLLLNALAASPGLHEWFHADSGQAGHQCAVTLFAQGKAAAASVDVPPVAPLTFIRSVPAVEFSVFSPAIQNLPPSRAPPVGSCHF